MPMIAFALAVGGLAAVLAAPHWLPGLVASLRGPEPHAFWYLSRASGIVAFVALWLSTLAGLGLSTKLAKTWPGAASALALHRELGWAGLLMTVFHGLILLGDRHVGFSLGGVLVPFASTHASAEVALGQIAGWGLVLLIGSFELRRRLGAGSWRILHFVSFSVFVGALIHGFSLGSDSGLLWPLYVVSAVSVSVLVAAKLRGQLSLAAASKRWTAPS